MAIPEERADALSVWPKFRKIGFRLLVLGGLLTAAAAAAMLGAFDPLIKNLLD